MIYMGHFFIIFNFFLYLWYNFIGDCMKNNKIIDISQFYDENVGVMNRIILKCPSETLSKFEDLLPNDEEINSDDISKSWRYGYLMSYFMGVIVADELSKTNISQNKSFEESVENIRFRMYLMFLRENYSKNIIYYEEFVAFSRLLNETIEHGDSVLEDGSIELIKEKMRYYSSDNLGIVYDIIHELNGNEYEFNKNKLRLAVGRVKSSKINALDEELDRIESKKKLDFKPTE